MQPFAAQHSLFRAYDIRGERQHFSSEFVQALGSVFAQLYNSQNHYHYVIDNLRDNKVLYNSKLTHNVKNEAINTSKANTVVIGYDVRCNSDTIAQTIVDILRQYDLIVIELGLITTPMMAFWAQQYDGHGIMVTASHSAKDILGIKWLVNNVSSSSADIQTLYQQLHSYNPQNINNSKKQHRPQDKLLNSNAISNTIFNALSNNDSSRTSLPTDQVATTYINAIAQVFTRIYQHNDGIPIANSTKSSKLDLTIVIDCMNGATSNIAQRLFERFCQNVIMLNDTPDGNFPTGNPDPTEPNRLAELQQTVIVNQADIGLAFDGDGDRLMIVDNSGKVVNPDHLLYLLAQVALNERPELLTDITDTVTTSQILFDVKCSHHLPKLITQLGATPVMSRTGSSLMRQQLQTCKDHVIFAGELSGHFVFNDGYFIVYDDAMYAGLRLIHWLVNTAATVNNILPATTDSWGELRPVLSPYKLTDITQNLPMMVSTADHYLPLSDTVPTNCPVVQQLAAFCHYLQHLVEESAPFDSFHNKFISSCKSSTCTCFSIRQHTTLVQAKQLLPLGTRLTCIDGVRLDFTRGFGVLRQSNTSNNLTVRFAGDSIADLKDVQMRFMALCYPFDKNLAKQIAGIYPE